MTRCITGSLMSQLKSVNSDDDLTELNQIFVSHQAQLLMQAGLLLSKLDCDSSQSDSILQLKHSLSRLKQCSESPQSEKAEAYQATIDLVKSQFSALLERSEINDKDKLTVLGKSIDTLKQMFDESSQKQQVLDKLRTTGISPLKQLSLKVLLICEDVDYVDFVDKQFQNTGVDITQTPSLKNLLAQLDNIHPQILIMCLADIDGALEKLTMVNSVFENRLINCQKIVIAPAENLDIRLKAIQSGCELVLVKSVDDHELLTYVRAMTEKLAGTKLNIAVLADSIDVANHHALVLKYAGMQTTVESSPTMFINNIQQQKPDLILIDVQYWQFSGLDLTKLVRQHLKYSQVPIILLASQQNQKQRIAASLTGVDAYLDRDISTNALVECIRNMAIRYRDVKKYLAKYSHQHLQFSSISSTSRDGYITCDHLGRIVSANNGALNMFAVSSANLINTAITDLFDKADHYWFKQDFERIEMKAIKADASVFSTDVSRYLWQLGDSTHCSLVIRDITTRKKFENTIQQAMADAENSNQAKSEFISAMSHELRTPLNAILGFAQLLEINRVDRLTDAQALFVKHIRDGGKHLLNLINDILDLAKIEAGEVAIQIEEVVIDDLVTKSVLLVEKQAQERGIQIHTTVSTPSKLPVFSDETRVTQVLINLLSNAVKYNCENGKITIDQHLIDKRTVGIYISDTGQGIPHSKRHQLFQPFNRLGAEATKIEGTGIGLSVAKKIMQLLGGRIDFKSEEGVGSTFWIELPLVEEAEQHAVEHYLHEVHVVPEMIENRVFTELKGKLLYIEDQEDNRNLFEALIKQFSGLELLLAEDAESGIKLALQELPDVIILDINLPGIDGYQALTKLRQISQTFAIPAIAITASAMSHDIERGLDAGFAHYMTKPIQVEELIGVLESLLPKIIAGSE